MISLLWERMRTRRALMMELLLAALVCVPLAARQSVRDAALSLLLPVTIMGALSAWAIVPLGSGGRQKAILLAAAGPLALFLYIGQTGEAFSSAGRESLLMLAHLFNRLTLNIPVDYSAWIAALNDLSIHLNVLLQRLGAWLSYAARGIHTEDPVARALAWSIGLWWAGAWGGWQVRSGRVLPALVPSTALVGLLANSNHDYMPLLWIHLTALFLLLGLTHYDGRLRRWEQAAHDYVEQTGLYVLASTTLLTALLVGSAFLASATSIKDFIDKLREEQRSNAAARSGAVRTELAPDTHRLVPQSVRDLLRPHRIGAGPQLSNDVVMVISTGELPRMPRYAAPNPTLYYWRGITYETYSRAGWNNPATALAELPAGEALLETPPPGYHLVHQQVRFPHGPDGRVYWTNTLLRLDVSAQAAWHGGEMRDDPLGAAELLAAFGTADTYNAESMRLEVKEDDLRKAPASYPAWISQRYLALPDSVPERVLALARNITAAAATPYDRARAIELYLRGFPYSLQVPAPPSGRDPVDYFLFDLKKGYCDYYATAMVVLSRAAGLPARFVTGYASGSYDPESASYIVTEANAHSWAEIYFPGSGWVEFEPTASLPLPHRQGESNSGAVSPQNSRQSQSLLGRVIRFAGQLEPMFWPGLGILLILLLVWVPAKDWLLARLKPVEAIGDFYRGIRQTARPLTGPLPASQTVHEYAKVLSGLLVGFEKWKLLGRWVLPACGELRALTDLYADSLFTLHPPVRVQVVQAARTWSRLRWRLLLVAVIASLKRGHA